jgi:hypothetical protein
MSPLAVIVNSRGDTIFQLGITCISFKFSFNLIHSLVHSLTQPYLASTHVDSCSIELKYLGSSLCNTTLNLLSAHCIKSSSASSISSGSFTFANISQVLSCSSVTRN